MPTDRNLTIDIAPATGEDAAHTRLREMEVQDQGAAAEWPKAQRAETALAIKELEAELQATVRGEVRFDDGSRAMYSTDGSNYRQVPIGVVIPKDADDVEAAIAACRKYGAPVMPRGGGTSLAGQCCNVAVVIDFSKYMHRVIEIDPDQRTARVQPGCILDCLRSEAEKHHLTFAPDPATHTHNCLGGMIGNNSCGIHSVMGGKTVDNINELQILTYDGLRMSVGKTPENKINQIIKHGGRRGEIYSRLRDLRDKYADLIREKYPDIPRRVSGYNLDQLLPENGFNVARALVGSEGTCVTVLEATCHLVSSPRARTLLVLGYPDVYSAGDHVPEILRYKPIGLEGIDDNLISDMRKKHFHVKDIPLLPEGAGWLLVEFGGDTPEDADDHAKRLMEDLERTANPPTMRLYDDPKQEKMVWEIRESGLGATAHIPGEPPTWPGFEDSAVPPDKVGQYLRDFRKLLDRYGYRCDLYGHFGQGCIHVRIDFDLFTKEGIDNYKRFMDDATDMVLSYGGSLSGEHGDGQSRAQFLPKMYGEELMEAFREFKSIWDPEWKMNPGKVIDPYRIDQNLRLGTDYNPPQPKTYFSFPEDENSFSRASLRCVGVGKCRRPEEGIMCPSFMATREEMHSTRGRARLLFEMLQGDPLKNEWRNKAVYEALDLCLACKGCKDQCPVNVDMATYKAEFRAHYFCGHLRPLNMYVFGLIYKLARVAELMPGMANFATHAPGLKQVFNKLVGVAQEREIPKFAPETFVHWFGKRPVRNDGKPEVLLWPDTWNNHFFPEVAKAAVEVLEAAGFQVIIPSRRVCCGRPLYDYGMLDSAIKELNRVLDVLRPQIQAGVPVVGLEPSCISVFRDELTNILPNSRDGRRLAKQSYMLTEFLAEHAKGFEMPKLARKALVHGHCHHKTVLDFSEEDQTLQKMGLDYEVLDSGCCGMAGAFGFEEDHYQVSMDCGERVLLPAVRDADDETLIVADGFSCREQIQQATDRHALHVAQVMQLALRDGLMPEGERPEAPYVRQREHEQSALNKRTAIGAGVAAALAGGAAYWIMKRRSQ